MFPLLPLFLPTVPTTNQDTKSPSPSPFHLHFHFHRGRGLARTYRTRNRCNMYLGNDDAITKTKQTVGNSQINPLIPISIPISREKGLGTLTRTQCFCLNYRGTKNKRYKSQRCKEMYMRRPISGDAYEEMYMSKQLRRHMRKHIRKQLILILVLILVLVVELALNETRRGVVPG